MPAFLVSFAVDRVGLESKVLHLPGPPLTELAATDLRDTLAIEHGGTVTLFNWDLLPDQDAHPSRNKPFCYFVSYMFRFRDKDHPEKAHGSGIALDSRPITTLAHVRRLEEHLASEVGGYDLHLITCRALAR